MLYNIFQYKSISVPSRMAFSDWLQYSVLALLSIRLWRVSSATVSEENLDKVLND